MADFNLDASALPLGPVDTWSGANIIQNAMWGEPTVVDSAGHRAVRFVEFDSMRWAATTYSEPAAFHAVVIVSGVLAGAEEGFAWWAGPGGLLPFGAGGFGPDGQQSPDGLGRLAVYSVITDETSSRYYLDGVKTGELPPRGATFSTVEVSANHGDAIFDVVRFTGSTGVVTDLVTEMNALVAEYTTASHVSVLGVSGTIAWSGVVSATTEDVWLPPDPPALPPGGTIEPPDDPEPQDPPAKVKNEPLRRLSEIMPAPTLDAWGNPVNWTPTEVIQEPVGRMQIVVEGVDITYFRDVETPFPSYSRVEPFGADQATIELPQITAFDALSGIPWLFEGANVSIRRVFPDRTKKRVWRGVITGFGHREDSGVFTVDCLGVMFTADLQLRQPPFLTTPQDVGRFVADTLNRTVGRRFRKVDRVTTGCKTSVLGGWEPRLTGAISQVLATSVRKGRQWTVTCEDRSPVIERKDTSTISWTVRNGQRGIAVELTRDITQAANVIYGEGVTPEGGRWRNARYPNWQMDDTPPYPGPMSSGMTVGYRDEQTSSGSGVSEWQEKAGQPVTGVLSQDDRLAWRRIQTSAEIRVDDSLGPQTWAATFQTGSNTGTLDGAFIAPLARSTQVEPYRYGPDGDVLGKNSRYDDSVLRVERYINFGTGVTKADARKAAQEMLARDADAGWVGTVTFRLDPNEGSKYDVVREGTNGYIRSFRGRTLKVHVARVEYRADEVVATVDTHARDYPTLDAILDREREAVDPARAYRRRPTSSTLSSDRATWDAEAPGGRIPKHALFGGLWNVLRIPVAQYGSVVRTSFVTSGPASPFAVAVFDRPITAAKLVGMVGNPLTASSNPWQDAADALDDAGLLMAWGWKEQPGGYFPKEYTNPAGGTSAPVTGRMRDDSSWEYASTQPPWLWVAMIARTSCQIEGRFWHGVIS